MIKFKRILYQSKVLTPVRYLGCISRRFVREFFRRLGKILIPSTYDRDTIDQCIAGSIGIIILLFLAGFFFAFYNVGESPKMNLLDISDDKLQETVHDLRIKMENSALIQKNKHYKEKLLQQLDEFERKQYFKHAKPRKQKAKRRPEKLYYDYSNASNEIDSSLLKKMIKVYDNLNTNFSFDCIQLKTEPAVPICIYPDEKDVIVSKTIREHGTWEPHIVTKYQALLKRDKSLGVIDIGANIGVYSLVAMAMGHKVVAAEPFIDSIHRLHLAAQKASLTNQLTILQNTISETRAILPLVLRDNNIGGILVNDSMPFENVNNFCYEKPKYCAQSLLMDDLVYTLPFKRAIIKVDIEGHEHKAFMHSTKLFKRLHIPYILMEWLVLRDYYGTEITISRDKDLVWELVNYLTELGYVPFGYLQDKPLKQEFWYGWPDNIIWKL